MYKPNGLTIQRMAYINFFREGNVLQVMRQNLNRLQCRLSSNSASDKQTCATLRQTLQHGTASAFVIVSRWNRNLNATQADVKAVLTECFTQSNLYMVSRRNARANIVSTTTPVPWSTL